MNTIGHLRLVYAALAASLAFADVQAESFDLTTASVAQINQAFDAGTLTAEKLVQLYLIGLPHMTMRGRRSTPCWRSTPRH